MATRYRLLDAYRDVLAEELEGNYCEGSVTLKVPLGDQTIWVEVPNEWVAEVKPPLPPEPADGVARCDAGYIHIKQGPSWTGHAPGTRNGPGSGFTTWASIHLDCDGAVLLVPDPLAAAPELPWHGSVAGSTQRLLVKAASVSPDSAARVELGEEFAVLDASKARQMGLALLRAAAQQEANS